MRLHNEGPRIDRAVTPMVGSPFTTVDAHCPQRDDQSMRITPHHESA
jgi:hypothetical protein